MCSNTETPKDISGRGGKHERDDSNEERTMYPSVVDADYDGDGNDNDNDNDATAAKSSPSSLPHHPTTTTPMRRPPCMMLEASFWSKAIFHWIHPLLKLGLERPLGDSDIPEIAREDSSKHNREYLYEMWDRERERCRVKNDALQTKHNQKNRRHKGDNKHKHKHKQPQPPNLHKPSLHRAILTDFFRCMWFVQPFMCLAAAARIVQAVYLGKLINSFENGGKNGYTFAGVIVACGLVTLFEHRKY